MAKKSSTKKIETQTKSSAKKRAVQESIESSSLPKLKATGKKKSQASLQTFIQPVKPLKSSTSPHLTEEIIEESAKIPLDTSLDSIVDEKSDQLPIIEIDQSAQTADLTQNIAISLDEFEQQSPLWRIKYRPKSLNAISAYYPTIYQQFTAFIKAQNFPHLIFVGPTGSGKTTLAEILGRAFLGDEFKINYQLLFADDPISKEERDESNRLSHIPAGRLGSASGSERRQRPFLSMRVLPFITTQKFGKAPFKICVIKNFHSLDVEQEAFRRLMEKYTQNCRFILITDRISGILDPIISRCNIVLVPFLPVHLFNRLLKTICTQEQIPITLDSITFIRYKSQGNIGSALDIMQLTKNQFGNISPENLSKTFGEMVDRGISTLFSQTLEGNFSAMRKTLRQIFSDFALSKNEILLELSRFIIMQPFERTIRAYYLNLIAQIDFQALDSTADEIQITDLLMHMTMIGKEALATK